VTEEEFAKYFDHTNLYPFAREKDIAELCDEAKKYGFASVCVNSGYVKFAKRQLKDSDIKVCTVVGFPLGAASTEAKACETRQAIKDGADEIDMVINIGALKDQQEDLIVSDIKEVIRAAEGRIVKVIIECCYLSNEEKRRACILVKKAGANFVKTSTGFGSPPEGVAKGATIEDVKLMKKVFGGDVKAAGGIRTLKDALAMIKAGASRIGCSSSVVIIEEFERNKNVT